MKPLSSRFHSHTLFPGIANINRSVMDPLFSNNFTGVADTDYYYYDDSVHISTHNLTVDVSDGATAVDGDGVAATGAVVAEVVAQNMSRREMLENGVLNILDDWRFKVRACNL